MAAAQPLFRLIDQNGAASSAQTQATWNRLFSDVQELYAWQGTNPFADLAALDHWELSQAAVTYLYKALEQYRWHTPVLLDIVYRQRVDAIFSFLKDAIGIVWIESVALVCQNCQEEVPGDAAYCIHCGSALHPVRIPQPQKTPPQIGKTRRLK